MTTTNPNSIVCSHATPFPLFKETDFQSCEIGKIPKDWAVKTAEELCVEVTDGTHDSPKAVNEGYFLVTSKHIKNGKIDFSDAYRISQSEFNKANKHSKAEPSDVLFSMIGTIGLTAKVSKDYPQFAIKNVGLFKLGGDETIADWLHYYFQSGFAKKYFMKGLKGSTQKYIPLFTLRKFPIVHPSKKEIKKITEILGCIDSAIELSDQIIAKTERLKRGLMQQLLTRGIEHTETKQTPIGQIPEKWTIVKLADIARVERGKFAHRPRNEPRFYGGKYPFIQTGDIASAKGLIKTYTQTLNEEGLEISRMFKKGTIVISIAGNIGDVGMLDFDACFPDSVIGITPCGEVDSFFLMYLLQYLQHDISAKAPRSTQKNINLDIIKPIKIPLPPLSEQQKISSILTEIGKKLEIEVNQKAKLENIKRGLMDLLLTGKVRIKVD